MNVDVSGLTLSGAAWVAFCHGVASGFVIAVSMFALIWFMSMALGRKQGKSIF